MNIKNIFLVGLTVFGFCSCSDFLDVDAPSKYGNEYVFNSKDEMNRLLNGIYAQLLSGNTYGSYYHSTFCLNSDVDMAIYTSDVSTNNSYRRFDCTYLGGEIENYWNASYKGIEYCNNFIYNLENSPIYSLDDPEIMQMMGEAKVIRAMFYHDMMVIFGDIPFSFTPSSNVEDYVMPVAERQYIYDQLIVDLKSIAPYMSFAKDLSAGVERVSKEFCWSMIARMALSCGGYSLHPNKDNPSSYGEMKRPDNYLEYYDLTREYCDSVITSGTHTLSLPYNKVFIDECNYIVNNGDDPIFEIPFAKNANGSIGYNQGPKGETYEGKSEGINQWGASSGGARLNAFYRFSFDEEDKRRDYVNGVWYYQYDGNPVILNDYTVFNNKWSKFWTTQPLGPETGGNTGINFPYMRYTDVLLMYAEAVNELENGVGGANGAKAIDAFRQVRQRAFDNPNKVDGYINEVKVSKESFLKAILDERKWEFAGENMRWKDLVRNNMYNEVVYYSFLRYYAMAENVGGMNSGIQELVESYDGKPGYLDNTPITMYYQIQDNFKDVDKYPNQTLQVLNIYNLYDRIIKSPGSDWLYTDCFAWWNEGNGSPQNQCLYSFFGYIRGDILGNIQLVGDGGVLMPYDNPDNLPVLRYILPYPDQAILRSDGVYKNYYGY